MWLARHHSRGPPASEAALGKGELLFENLKELRKEGVVIASPLVLSLLVHAPLFSIIVFLSTATKFRVPTFLALKSCRIGIVSIYGGDAKESGSRVWILNSNSPSDANLTF
ncbi:hypothetical protein L1987_64063 [Smallanthus sonchifolius]|uniref:Uncharacterized protein n=1 Tax=Smallanthus sonchifolius TaxID=185202 RepID=A0ACB9CF19_9ASTR|nr:hypothetical protein L1987_64063 [Smallanthus sonchifolius]